MINGETALIYRGSRDGYTVKAFHDRCENKWQTIYILRSHLKYICWCCAAASRNSNDEYIKSEDGTSFLF